MFGYFIARVLKDYKLCAAADLTPPVNQTIVGYAHLTTLKLAVASV